MLKNVKCLESSEGNVWKYIFDFGDAIAEAVLYRYGTFEERTVICCSVQSGCPVGCGFCGTGKHFVRNLTVEEIVGQIKYILEDKDIKSINNTCAKLQIMFMSMGEPMLNWYNVKFSILQMYHGLRWENAQYLISTIGVNDDDTFASIIELSKAVPNVGLQFSIHNGYEIMRNILIPFKNKMSLRKLRDAGIIWSESTGRKVFLNYCVTDENSTLDELSRLKDLFSPYRFNFTFSTVCTADENMKEVGFRDLSKIEKVAESFIIDGYNTRVFNPAGQDDIGGGCGQLWYVQDWLHKHKRRNK
jgi:23S rRNA (adenine2503-C2)-methyltransferase